MMKLDEWQKQFLATEGDKILCTGRQVGKSVVCGIDAGEYAVKHAKKVILMIAFTERQAYALFEKTLAYLVKTYPSFIKMGKNRPTKSKLMLNNGTIIWCLPTGTTGAGIRFLTVNRLYEDEASRIPPEVQDAVEPMLLTTGGDTILLSTPAGKQGYFYDVWKNEENKYDSFTRFSVFSETVMKERPICKTWTTQQREKALIRLEQAKMRMTRRAFAQEYLGEFVDDLMRFFPDSVIKACLRLKRAPPSNERYYLGVDIGRLGGNESVFSIIEKKGDFLKQRDNIITVNTLTTDSTKLIIDLEKEWHFRRIYVDSAGVGGGVFDQLLNTPETKRKVIPIENARRSLDNEEKKTKKLFKEDLYHNLLMLMERKRIYLIDDPEIFQSLASVQYEYTPEGNIKIFGRYTHCAESLIRAAWCTNDKSLSLYIF